METLQKNNFTEDARHFFRKFPVDKDIDNYKAGLIDVNELKNVLVLRDQFFYITDIRHFTNVYVSGSVASVLGYPPDDLTDLEFVYDIIHPADAEFVYAFSKRSIEWAYYIPGVLLIDPYAGVFSIDFRMRCAIGKYIRVNRQTACYKTDLSGNMVYAISLFTDINHIKQNNLITYAWKTSGMDFSIDDLILRYRQHILTFREKEIIRYLSQGMNARQIGTRLFISEHTVIAHRKNILHKTGTKNTADLVRYAIETGVI